MCCGPVPFPVATFNKYAYRAGVKKWKSLDLMEDKDKTKLILAVTDDASCIFLENNNCSIYEDRPDVCRKFGPGPNKLLKCPHINKEGTLRKDKDGKEKN